MLLRLNQFNHYILQIYTSVVCRVDAHALSTFSCRFGFHREILALSSSPSNRRRVTFVNLLSIDISYLFQKQQVYPTQPKVSSLLAPTLMTCSKHLTAAVILGENGSLLARFVLGEVEVQRRGKHGGVLQETCCGWYGERLR